MRKRALQVFLILILVITGCTQKPNGEYLHNGHEFLAVATNAEALDQAFDAIETQNTEKLHQLVENHDIIAVKDRTRVTILAWGQKRSKIKILEGEYVNCIGYITTSFIKSNRPYGNTI